MPDFPKLQGCFFQAIEHQPFSAALILGKMLQKYWPNPKRRWHLFIEQVSGEQLTSVVLAYTQLSPTKKRLLDPDAKKQLEAVCTHLLQQECFAEKATDVCILELGKHKEWSRLALYRLMQKANPNHPLSTAIDLFDVGQEQSYEQVAAHYQSCPNLPQAQLLSMITNSAIARIVLLDLSHHPERFGLSEQLIEKFPQLATEIAEHWHLFVQVNLRPEPELKALKQAAKRLSKKHAAFKPIETSCRQSQVEPAKVQPSSKLSFWEPYRSLSRFWLAYQIPAASQVTHGTRLLVQGLISNTAAPSLSTVLTSTAATGASIAIPLIALYYLRQSTQPTPDDSALHPQAKPSKSVNLNYKRK